MQKDKSSTATVQTPVKYEFFLYGNQNETRSQPSSQPLSPVTSSTQNHLSTRRNSTSLPDMSIAAEKERSADERSTEDEMKDFARKDSLLGNDANGENVDKHDETTGSESVIGELDDTSSGGDEASRYDQIHLQTRDVRHSRNKSGSQIAENQAPADVAAITSSHVFIQEEKSNDLTGFSHIVFWTCSRDLLLTLATLIVFALVSYAASVAVSYTDRYYNLFVASREVLPDLVFGSTYKWALSVKINRFTSNIMGIISAVLMLLKLLATGSSFCKNMRRVLLILVIVYCVRVLCITFTILPNPNAACRSFPLDNMALDALLIMFNGRSTCGDVFFSGNVINYAICALTWTYLPLTQLQYQSTRHLLTAVVVLFNILACIFVVIIGADYSIDVIMAIFCTFTVWLLVWTSVETGEIKYARGNISSLLGRLDDVNWYENAMKWHLVHGTASQDKEEYIA